MPEIIQVVLPEGTTLEEFLGQMPDHMEVHRYGRGELVMVGPKGGGGGPEAGVCLFVTEREDLPEWDRPPGSRKAARES